ncbi:MAG TPA: D-alanine--D-alanine ligase [Anaerolineae bacterium]|nr:D-alanine--D-alanine ligase [Anaerolineae bacterium]
MRDQEGKPPGVVVLYNASEDLIKGELRDLIADRGVIACAEAVYEALTQVGYQVVKLPFSREVELVLAPYPANQWIVFNLAEGLAGRLFEEARIAWALEAMGYRFTGSDGAAIARSLHKARAKELLMAKRVATPAWWLFHHPDEVQAFSGEIRFPLIVKPVAEDASIGLDAGAVVHTLAGLRKRVAYVVERYRQTALAEAFIVGRELNVSLWGEPPRVLPLAEIDFSAFSDPHERIVSFAAKWEEDSFEYQHTPVLCPAEVDVDLKNRVKNAAKRAWDAIRCRGYARVDMRIDGQGIPYVVEINCNPDLSPDAGFARAALTAGYSYQDMVVKIVELARREVYVDHRAGVEQGWPVHLADNSRGRRLQTDRSILR